MVFATPDGQFMLGEAGRVCTCVSLNSALTRFHLFFNPLLGMVSPLQITAAVRLINGSEDQ